MIQWLRRHQITNNKKKQQVMDKGVKQGNDLSIVIVNSKANTRRPITLEVPVQERKLKLKRGGRRQYKFRTGSGGELRYL